MHRVMEACVHRAVRECEFRVVEAFVHRVMEAFMHRIMECRETVGEPEQELPVCKYECSVFIEL